MKFGKLTLLWLSAAQASKNKKKKKPRLPKPTYQDCVDGGIAADIVGNHNLSCRGHKCSIKCASGLELVGGKKVECRRDKKNPERLYIHPAKVPKCTTCTPLEKLIDFNDYKISTKIKRKGPEYTLQCVDQVNILPFNMFYLSAKCFCDKKKGECYWQGQGKLNIQAQISKMRCETNEEEKVDDNDLEDIIKRPLQITPGLTCGKSNDRIVGGVEAEEHSWPWIVQLKYHSDPTVKAGHTCSGTIVADNIIVTAAHCCAAFKDLKKLTGVVAEHSVINHIDDAYYIKFERKIMHPEYKSWTLENDICLLVPKERLTLESRPEFDQPKTARACLPRQNEANPPSSTHCWTAGWGRLSFKGQLANVLNEVHVKLIDDRQCANSNTGSILHLSSQKCAGHLEGGLDACQGDSGGPLICAENGQPVLRGIVSGGIGCALPNNAGIYTRIEKYIEWINMYQVLSRSAIREKKHALMAQRSNFVSTHREAHRLLYHLVSEGKLEY